MDFGMEALMDTKVGMPTDPMRSNISADVDDALRAMDSPEVSDDDGAAESETGDDALSVVSSRRQYPRAPRYPDAEDTQAAKRELMYQFDRLQKKGYKVPQQFTMASDLAEMRAEYERVKRDRSVDASIAFQRKLVIAAVSGVEFLNGKFDPFNVKLDGWSENVQDNVNDMDDVFEELYDKYKTKGKLPPEIRLLMSLCGSAVMAHLTNTLFKNSLPGMDQVLKQNPGLMKQFASAAMGTMAGNAKQGNGGEANVTSGLAGFMSNMFSGPMSMHSGSMMGAGGAPPKPAGKMSGPGNFDAILRETQNFSSNMRGYPEQIVEVVSVVSDDDVVSIGGFSMASARKGAKKILNM